jgi:hypothetical protein
MLSPTEQDRQKRSRVLKSVISAVKAGRTIRLIIAYDVDSNENYAGVVGEFEYLFEGEDDLLHLAVMRSDGAPLTPQDGQAVAKFLLEGMPPGLVWIRPGEHSQHFYMGHDDLVAHVHP